MKVRELEEKDYDAVVELWRRAGLEHRPEGRDSRESFVKQLGAYGGLMICAEEGGSLIGVAIGSHDHRKGWINRLAVDPERRRGGVAKALIARLEEEFAGLGIKIIAATIFDHNMESIRLFESRGFLADDRVKYFSKRESWDV